MVWYTPENLPEKAKTCQNLKDKARFFVEVTYLGRPFYVPITENIKRIFNIHIKNGVPEIPKNLDFEDFLRDLISSIYLQIRDTVGEEIKSELDRKIQEGFSEMFNKMFGDNIQKKIEDGLDPKCLSEFRGTHEV
jgi:hypothetical protein